MDIELQSDEGIISYFEQVTYYYNGKNIDGTLYITNLNLIFVQHKGIFQKQFLEYKFPLAKIKIINDKVQLLVKEDKKEKTVGLAICMKPKIEKFEVDWADKAKAYLIADEICRILNNSLYPRTETQTESFAFKVGNVISKGVTSFAAGLLGHNKKTITKNCKVCKAEIKGISGEEITCKFCGCVQKM